MNSLVGTWQLVRLYLRRDRLLLLIWIGLVVIVPVSFVSALAGLFPTEAARQQFANTVALTPIFIAFYGPIFSPSLGGLVAWRTGIVPIAVAVISLLTVIRHTRTEEEAGRRELLGSGVVGRQAGLAAAMTVTIVANLVLAILIWLGMISQNLPSVGSFALGLQYASVGWVFAAIGAVAAQLTNRAGTARAMGFGVLGVAFFLRIVGDVTNFSWLAWLSPLEWTEQLRPFGGERWWIFIPIVVLLAALLVAASRLLSYRDIGTGLIPSRPGPALAAPGFRSPVSLAWRLQRNLLIGWTAGLGLMGIGLGGIASSLTSLLSDTPELGQVIARLGGNAAIIDAYFAGITGLFALIVAGYAVQATLRMRSEEVDKRAEPLLATSVSRFRWAVSHLLFGFLGPAVVLGVMGLTAGLIHGINVHDLANQLPRILAAALVQLPAVWVLVGLAVAFYGLLPRLIGVIWVVLGLFTLVLITGAVLNLPQWVFDLSPFTHIPKVPGGPFTSVPLIILVAVAVFLTTIGLIGFKNRDFGKV